MESIQKDPSVIFFENLAAITGAGALVKLDLSDDLAMKNRVKLSESRHRPVEVFTSALMIYFCNVLDSNGFAKDHQDQFKMVVGVADILATGWVLYDVSQSLNLADDQYKNINGIEQWLDIKLPEVFSYGLDKNFCPQPESLKYILEDFDRISNVFDTLASNS